jgi:hypothetical protein
MSDTSAATDPNASIDPSAILSNDANASAPAPITDPAQNLSNQLDVNSLFSQLLNNATTAYSANQTSNAQIAAAQASASAMKSNPLAFIQTIPSTDWIFIIVGLFALSLIAGKK